MKLPMPAIALFAALVAGGCSTGTINGAEDVDIAFAGIAPFAKFDAAPDEANAFGIQAIVHYAPFGSTYRDPAILLGADAMRLYYAVDGRRIELATSPDGIEWTIVGTVLEATEPWEGGRVSGPAVLRVGAEVHLYYEGGVGAGIGLAVAADGVSFAKHASNPLLAPAEPWEAGRIGNPTVAVDAEGARQMVYDGAGGRGLGAARTLDGIAWTRVDGDPSTGAIDPIVSLGGSGSFDADRAADPSLLIEDAGRGRAVFRVWYTGEGGGNASPGVAASFDGAIYRKYDFNPVLDEVLILGGPIDEDEPAVVRLPDGVAASMYYAQPLGFAQGIALAVLRP